MYTDAATAVHQPTSRPARSYPARSYPARSYPARSYPAPARPPVPRFEEHTQLVASRPSARPRIRPAGTRTGHRWLRLTVWILIATGVLLGAVLGGVWFLGQRDSVPVSTEVGTCLARTGTDGIAAVGCGDPAAQFKVVSRVDGRTRAEAPTACAGVREATGTYWEGTTGSPGTVLCLAPTL